MTVSPFVILPFGQVQVQIQVHPITVENFSVHLAQESARIKQTLADRERSAPYKAVVIVDGSVAMMPPSAVRKLQADWVAENKDLLQLVTHQIGFVLPNPILRGFVTAVFYLVPLPVPSTTLGSLEEAVDWAIREITSIGGVVDDALLTHGSSVVVHRRADAMTKARIKGTGS